MTGMFDMPRYSELPLKQVDGGADIGYPYFDAEYYWGFAGPNIYLTPEPGTLLLCGMALLALAARRLKGH